MKEWSGFTPERHRASLVQDFLKPDFEERRNGACIRLGYYYPDALQPLVLKQLSAPTYNIFAVENLVREQLYKTSDLQKRKSLLDRFVAKNGKIAREGIIKELFDDLQTQEEDEKGQVSPPLSPKFHARECLIHLFGYPRAVSSKQDPGLQPFENCALARFIDGLEYFPAPQYDQSIRRILRSTDEDYLATACVNYLIGRGADADIRQYIVQHKQGASAQKVAELNALKDRIGWTPLHLAVEQDQVERASMLVRHGADINAKSANGQTPMHIAAARADAGAVQDLLGWKADPNITDNEGRTPMRLAAAIGSESTVRTLVDAGVSPSTVLEASLAGRADLVEVLLNRNPTSVNMRTDDGETSLLPAARLGYADVVRVLLAHGADVNAHDRSKLTPLHRAAEYNQYEVVKLLLKYKADRNAKSWDGKTALDFAAETGDKKTIGLLKAN